MNENATQLPLVEPPPPSGPVLDGLNDGAGIWTLRRRFIYVTTAFCMGVVAYVLHYDMRGAVAETSVTMSFVAIMSIAGSYVFGAAWDDHSARQFGGMRGRARRGDGVGGGFGW